MTDVERLAEIEARVEAAIPGPWLRMGTEISKPTVDIVRWSYEGLPPSEWEGAEEDIAPTLDFIAAAREDIPWLLEQVREAREALLMLRDACAHCMAAGRPPNQQMIDNADTAL